MGATANNYTLYMHTTPSGKVYIGITKQKPERRWRGGEGYRPPAGRSSPFYEAIIKYGWDNIKHEILAEGLTKAEACELEQVTIQEHEAQDSRKGYNVLNGGEVPMADCPQAVRQKMSESAFKKWSRPEYIEKHTGDNHWTHKAGYSEKSIEAMRQSNIGRKRTPAQVEFLREKAKRQPRRTGRDNKKSIPIACYSKDGQLVAVYYGSLEAERNTGICYQNIYKACKGERKTAGGYVWRFAEEENDEQE